MIWQFKSHSIVQLCQTEEEGQEKCYMYWPTKEGELTGYGQLNVTLQSEVAHGDFMIRKFDVSPMVIYCEMISH